jgi:TonB family protein
MKKKKKTEENHEKKGGGQPERESPMPFDEDQEEKKRLARPYRPIVLKKGLFFRFLDFSKELIKNCYSALKKSLFNRKERKSLADNPLLANLYPSSYRTRLEAFFGISLLLHLLLFLPLLSKALEQKKIVNSPLKVKIIDIPEVSKIKTKKVKSPTKPVETKVKKIRPKKVKVAKKIVKKPEQKKEQKPIPEKVRTQEKFDKPKLLASKIPDVKQMPREQEQELKLLKKDTDIKKKSEASKQIPDLFKSKENLRKPATSAKPLDIKHKGPKQNPKILVSQADKIEKRFNAAKEPYPLSNTSKLKEKVSGERKSKEIPEEFTKKEEFRKPAEPIAPLTETRPKKLASSKPATSSGIENPQSRSEDLKQLLSDEGSIAHKVKPEKSSKDVIDQLKGREVFKAPEGPVVMAKAPIDLRKKAEHPLVKDKEAVYVSMDSDDPKFKDYLEKVRRRIFATWRYPENERLGLSGRVSLEFSVEIDGTVSRVSIISSSGHSSLDGGASGAVERAAPFPPVPPSLLGNKRRLAIGGRFRYN